MARGKLKDPHRPPVKAPSIPAFKPRLWCMFDGWWTQTKGPTEPGYWQTFCDVNLTPMYGQGQRCFIINLPFGVTGKAGGQYEYDAGLYRSGTYVSELVPTLTAHKKAHPGSVFMFYMGDMVTVFRNPDGSSIDARVPANLEAAQARIEAATAQIQPVADMIAIDGSARYDASLDATKDPANGGMYKWFSERVDDVRKKTPVVLESTPAATNQWASTLPWICQDEVFDMHIPTLLQGAPAGQERIVLIHSLGSTDPQWLTKIQQYQQQGYSVAPLALAGYVLVYRKPLSDVARLFK